MSDNNNRQEPLYLDPRSPSHPPDNDKANWLDCHTPLVVGYGLLVGFAVWELYRIIPSKVDSRGEQITDRARWAAIFWTLGWFILLGIILWWLWYGECRHGYLTMMLIPIGGLIINMMVIGWTLGTGFHLLPRYIESNNQPYLQRKWTGVKP